MLLVNKYFEINIYDNNPNNSKSKAELSNKNRLTL